MTIAVRDNRTNEIVTRASTNDWAAMYVRYIDQYRRNYSNATIEVYYSNDINGNPVSKWNTFC
jgi:hypothetical protein